MVRLYLDEDMSLRLVKALSDLGFDAFSADSGYKGLYDADQLLVSRSLDRVFITNNTGDFLLLHRAWVAWSNAWGLAEVARHPGLLLIHSAPGFDARRVADAIKSFSNDGIAQPENIENR